MVPSRLIYINWNIWLVQPQSPPPQNNNNNKKQQQQKPHKQQHNNKNRTNVYGMPSKSC